MLKRVRAKPIELGIGFEPNEEVITHKFNGIPLHKNPYPTFYKYITLTNHRIIFSQKPRFDIVEVDWEYYNNITGAVIENDGNYYYLAIYSNRKKKRIPIEYLFTFFYPQEGIFGISYKYHPDSRYYLEDFKNLIRGIIKEKTRTKTKPQSKREHIQVRVQREVWRRDEGKCVKCGSNENLEYDHMIPFSKGGSSTARNLQLLCEKCNREKSDKI